MDTTPHLNQSIYKPIMQKINIYSAYTPVMVIDIPLYTYEKSAELCKIWILTGFAKSFAKLQNAVVNCSFYSEIYYVFQIMHKPACGVFIVIMAWIIFHISGQSPQRGRHHYLHPHLKILIDSRSRKRPGNILQGYSNIV